MPDLDHHVHRGGLGLEAITSATSSPTVGDDIASKQVSWFPVHEYVSALIAQSGVERWPVVGTPAWVSLHVADPRKFVAVLDAAQHAALNWDGRQEALAAAASDVSEAEDWRKVGSEIAQRESYFEAHPWMRRTA